MVILRSGATKDLLSDGRSFAALRMTLVLVFSARLRGGCFAAFALELLLLPFLYFEAVAVPVTRQMVLPTSSATSSAPRLSIARPTGRPWARPFESRNPSTTVMGNSPVGLPFAKGTKIT